MAPEWGRFVVSFQRSMLFCEKAGDGLFACRGFVEERSTETVQRVAGVHIVWKEVASVEKVQKAVPESHYRVVLQVGAGAEQCCT